MVFSSPAFLFYFLPAVLAVYYVLRGTKAHNAWLLVCSVVFYYLGGGYFTGILLLSITVNFGLGLIAQQTRGGHRAKLIVAAAIAINVFILAYFKYANFFVDQANALQIAVGLSPFGWAAIALPIGVSFYTFHAMSYVIDIARGDSDAKRNPIDFALYVTFFPQLIAGPIVRYHLVETQLTARTETAANFEAGVYRFCWGLSKKVLVADQVAGIANAAFSASTGTSWTAGTAWFAVLAYTVQIYFDFSGYSDMAIGLARMFGFKFPENFNRPYSAISVTDFWRRWHMTLSNWFRDYLYIPIGGSRGSAARVYRNLGIVFLLTGLWHGAAWTFIVWGAYHGALLIIERVTGLRDLLEHRFAIARRLATLFLVMIGWIFFRSDDLSEAATIIKALFTSNLAVDAKVAAAITHQTLAALSIGILMFAAPPNFVVGRLVESDKPTRLRSAIRFATLGVLFPTALAYALLQDFSPFLYYQF